MRKSTQIIVLSIVASSASPAEAAGGTSCSFCGDANNAMVPQTPDSVIPLLNIPGPVPITCQVAYDYASILEESDPACQLLQEHAVYCQCPNAPGLDGPICTLCPDGNEPEFKDRLTPYGDTCQQLDSYLRSFTQEQCANVLHESSRLMDSAYGCGCNGVSATCPMCTMDGGSIDMAHEDRVIPFLTWNDGMINGGQVTFVRNNPTCLELAMLAATASPTSELCRINQAQAGFCGCDASPPLDECSFCPDGSTPAQGTYILETEDSCDELATYMRYMDEQECQSERASDMKALGYVCGCKDAQPRCTLCPDGSQDFNPDAVTNFNDDADYPTECWEVAMSIASLPDEACYQQRKTTIGISSVRCGCPDAKLPVCPSQQNAHLCTAELVRNALQRQGLKEEDCECMSFCDGQFKGCSAYPGDVLTFIACGGERISGCNSAIAGQLQQEQQHGKNHSGGSSQQQFVWFCNTTLTLSIGMLILL